jgi:hypothetical protein
MIKKVPYSINLDTDKFSKNEMSIFVNYKIYDRTNSNIIALAGLAVHIDTIYAVIKEFSEITGSSIFLITDEGKIALSTTPNKNDILYKLLQDTQIKQIIASKKDTNNIVLNNEYERYINIKYINELDWFFVIDYPIDNVFIFMYNNSFKTIIIFCSSLVLTLLIITRIVIGFENRIVELTVFNVFDAIMTDNSENKKSFYIKKTIDMLEDESYSNNVMNNIVDSTKRLLKNK